MRRASLPLLLTGCVGFAACGGGGGAPQGSAPRATATPTAASSTDGSTSFVITSVPSGLHVSYSDGLQTVAGTTPATVSPPLSNVASAVSFEPDNGNPVYTYTGFQRNDGAQQVLYNERADTTGTLAIAASGAAAGARASDARSRASANAAMAREPRRFAFGSAGRSHASETRVVVRYRTTGGAAPFVGRNARAIGPVRANLATVALDAPAGTTAPDYAARLRAMPGVVDAQPDVLEYVQTANAVTPNDTHFDDYEQWSAFEIGAVNAWGYTEGSPSIAIAVIDTGADFSHPDLAGAKIAYAESDLDGVTTTGAAAAQDTDGHGTNVAGIAAADTNNAFGFAGIGFDTSLQIYKVFADDTAANGYAGESNASDVTLAIYSAVAHGARVINLSLGSCAVRGFDVSQQDAIEYAISRGVVVVAASGNERGGTSGDPACAGINSTLDFPAAYDGVISVGASKVDDSANPGILAGAKESVASYSNDGPGLSLVAPGGEPTAADLMPSATIDQLHFIDGLYSTTAANPSAQCQVKTDCRASFAGTSQATAHVSGAAALLLAANPNLGVAQIRTLLLASADDIGDPNEGSGRLDVYRALAAAEGDANPPAAPSTHDFVAFAYTPSGTASPHIIDVSYPAGVPVSTGGTFRVADVPAGSPSYKIAVWYDANGDGLVDAGDYFATSGPCTAASPCASAAKLTAVRVTGTTSL